MENYRTLSEGQQLHLQKNPPLYVVKQSSLVSCGWVEENPEFLSAGLLEGQVLHFSEESHVRAQETPVCLENMKVQRDLEGFRKKRTGGAGVDQRMLERS